MRELGARSDGARVVSRLPGTVQALRDAARQLIQAAEQIEGSDGYREYRARGLIRLAIADAERADRQLDRIIQARGERLRASAEPDVVPHAADCACYYCTGGPI